MFKFIRDAIEAVEKGNAYRLEKYGPPETFSESLQKAKTIRKKYKEECVPKCLPFFANNTELQNNENFKLKFNYWDEWTGGRFARRENPYISMSDADYTRKFGSKKPSIEINSVCRSNPVTGYWEAL